MKVQRVRSTSPQGDRRTGRLHPRALRLLIVLMLAAAPAVLGLASAGAADPGDVGFGWARGLGRQCLLLSRRARRGAAGDRRRWRRQRVHRGVLRRDRGLRPGEGTFELTAVGLSDVFVSKLDAAGAFVWARSWGGPDRDRGYGVALDGDGNVYAIGTFLGEVDFDPGTGSLLLQAKGGSDIFLSKLGPAGDLVWVGAWGSDNDDDGFAVATDDANVYITGRFSENNEAGPDLFGVLENTTAEGSDVFVAKWELDGDPGWARSWGGWHVDIGYGIAVDEEGSVYTTGSFYGPSDFPVDFDPGSGEYLLYSTPSVSTNPDVFVSKLDADGLFVWARGFGGGSGDEGLGVAVDDNGNVYSTGAFRQTADFDPGPDVYSLYAGWLEYPDVFVSKLDADGDFVWARRWGDEPEGETRGGRSPSTQWATSTPRATSTAPWTSTRVPARGTSVPGAVPATPSYRNSTRPVTWCGPGRGRRGRLWPGRRRRGERLRRRLLRRHGGLRSRRRRCPQSDPGTRQGRLCSRS